MTQRRWPSYGINRVHNYVKLLFLMDGYAPATITVLALISLAQRQLAGASRRVETVGFGDRQLDWAGRADLT
jgi:hypothetical protein